MSSQKPGKVYLAAGWHRIARMFCLCAQGVYKFQQYCVEPQRPRGRAVKQIVAIVAAAAKEGDLVFVWPPKTGPRKGRMGVVSKRLKSGITDIQTLFGIVVPLHEYTTNRDGTQDIAYQPLCVGEWLVVVETFVDAFEVKDSILNPVRKPVLPSGRLPETPTPTTGLPANISSFEIIVVTRLR